MFQPFHTTLHSLCSSGATAQTMQTCAQRSNAWARPQTYPLPSWRQFRVQVGDVHARVANYAPSQSTRRDSVHQPKSFSNASAWFSTAAATLSRPTGPEYWRAEHAVQEPNPGYRSKYAFFCPRFAYPHRSRAAPFFGRFDRLAVQDGGTGVGKM